MAARSPRTARKTLAPYSACDCRWLTRRAASRCVCHSELARNLACLTFVQERAPPSCHSELARNLACLTFAQERAPPSCHSELARNLACLTVAQQRAWYWRDPSQARDDIERHSHNSERGT